MLRSIRLGLESLRRLIDLVGVLLIAGFAILFILQFGHPPQWDTLSIVSFLHRWGDPVLAKAAPWVSVHWPASSTEPGRFLPIGMLVVVFFARTALNGLAGAGIERCRAIEKAAAKRQRRMAAAQAPIRDGATFFRPAPAVPHAAPAGPTDPTMGAPHPSAQTPAPAVGVPLTKFLEGPPEEEQPAPPVPAAPAAAARAPAAPAQKAPPPAPPPAEQPIEAGETLAGSAPTLQGSAPTVNTSAGMRSPSLSPSLRSPSSSGRRMEARKIPDHVGRYEIVQELGRGAMGVVYKAKDPQIGRTVAIKTILSASMDEDALDSYKQRFYREAKAVGQMDHSGIVAVYDLIEDEAGQPCMVMEFVEGTTLEKVMAKERMPLGQAVDLIGQVAEALDYAHSKGVIHRDIKPANILVTSRGEAKITDFGIAKMEGAKLTQTGQLLGTPAFMSPEQFMGSAIDSRTDIFSLGSIFYWLCTGEKAFPGETVTAIAYKVVQTAPIPARQLNPALPDDIDVILSRCLAKSPDKRYPTGHLLGADLEAFKAGRPVAAAGPAVTSSPKD